MVEIKDQIETLRQYLLVKVDQKDWHGVSDAANDLRVLEAKLEMLGASGDESENGDKVSGE